MDSKQNNDQNQPVPTGTYEERQMLADLYAEADGLPDLDKQAHLVAIQALEAEIRARDDAYRQAIEHIEQAKSLASSIRHAAGEIPAVTDASAPKAKVDLKRIGWAEGEGTQEITTVLVTTPLGKCLLADLTGLHRSTRDAAERLQSQGELDKLMDRIRNTVLPTLAVKLQGGDRSLRPVHIGNRRLNTVAAAQSLNTTYKAYKEDVEGSNNRAILLILEPTELPAKPDGTPGEVVPTFGVAAIYDHDDDRQIHNSLFLKQGTD
jgi:hypothetical protein